MDSDWVQYCVSSARVSAIEDIGELRSRTLVQGVELDELIRELVPPLAVLTRCLKDWFSKATVYSFKPENS